MNSTNPFAKSPLANTEDTKEDKTVAPKTEADTTAEAVGTSEADTADAAADTKKQSAPKTSRKAAPKKMTAAQERDALRAEVEELRAKIEGKPGDLEVFVDRVVAEDGVGGKTRVVGDGRTIVNQDWQMTKDGLRVIVGRASAQATSSFQLPVSLVMSLADLITHFDAEIGEGSRKRG